MGIKGDNISSLNLGSACRNCRKLIKATREDIAQSRKLILGDFPSAIFDVVHVPVWNTSEAALD